MNKRKPLGVTVGVVAVDVVVVVLPVAGPSVVGRVDVDAVDSAGMGELEGLQRVVVLALDYNMCLLVAPRSTDPSRRSPG